jgi:DNA-binding beta-propeller fold protein YncE
MYATSSSTDSFYSVNLDTGVATLIGVLGGTPASTNPNGLAYCPADGQIYMADNSTDTLYTINPDTGAATAVGSMGSGNVLGLVWLPDQCPGSACSLADVTDIGDTGAGPDNQLTVDDIIAFVNTFGEAAGCPGAAPCNRADVTDIGDTGAGPDGELTVDDIIAFVNAFGEGC